MRFLKKIPVSVNYNMARDFSWYITAFFFKKNEFEQCYVATAAMGALLGLRKSIKCITHDSKSVSQEVVTIVSASLAMPVWNQFCKWGINLGYIIGIKKSLVGYLVAAPLCGFGEGLAQEVVSAVGSVLLNEEERKKFIEDPKRYIQMFVDKLGYCLKWGWMPGAMWQVISEACQSNNVNEIGGAFLLTLGVALCNIYYARSQKTYLEEELWIEPEEETEAENEIEIKNEAQKCCDWNFFGNRCLKINLPGGSSSLAVNQS